MRFSFLSFFLVMLVLFGTSTANAGYVYSIIDSAAGNMIYGYSADEATGELTPLSGFPIATGYLGGGNTNLEHLAYDPVHKFLFAANRGSSNISVYSVNAANGAITPTSFSPITSVANQRTLKIHPSGSPLIVGADNFASFVITATSASPAPNSPYTLPTGVSPAAAAMSPDGSYYYAGGNSGNFFAGYSINAATGEMTALAGNPFDSTASNPVPVDVDASGRLFVFGSRQSVLRVYTLASGIPTAVTANPFTYGESGFASVSKIHPNGNFIILPNRTRNYAVSAAIAGSGSATTISVVSGSPFATGGTTSLAGVYNTAGTRYFVANAGSRNITRFNVDPATGVLSSPVIQAADTLGTTGSISGIVYVATPISAPINVSGRVLRADGSPVSGARVTIEGNSTKMIAITNAFGYYSFTGVMSYQHYTVTAQSKTANFNSLSLDPQGNVSDADIIEAVNTFSRGKE